MELHEASPRLGRVMGIAGGQTEPATSGPETLSEEEITNKEAAADKSRAEDEVAVGLAAGKPWPVASGAPARLIKLSLLVSFSAWRTFVNIL